MDTGSAACSSTGGIASCGFRVAASWTVDTGTAGIESVACASTGGFDCSASWLAKSANSESEPCTSAGASVSCASRVVAWGAGSWTVDTGTAGIESVACASAGGFTSCITASGVGCWVADTGTAGIESVACASTGGFDCSASWLAKSANSESEPCTSAGASVSCASRLAAWGAGSWTVDTGTAGIESVACASTGGFDCSASWLAKSAKCVSEPCTSAGASVSCASRVAAWGAGSWTVDTGTAGIESVACASTGGFDCSASWLAKSANSESEPCTSAGASVSCASRVVAWGAGSWIVDTGMAGIESVACASIGGFDCSASWLAKSANSESEPCTSAGASVSCASRLAAWGAGSWTVDTGTAGIESVACASTGGFDCSASWLAKSAKCVSEPCTSAGASVSCASRVAAWGAGSWTVDTGTAGIESVACASAGGFTSCMAASGVGCWVADTVTAGIESVACASTGGFTSCMAASGVGCWVADTGTAGIESVACASTGGFTSCMAASGAGSWTVDTGTAGIESVACASAGGFSSCMAASGVGCWVADTVTAGIESVACASTGGFDCSASWLAKSAKSVSEPCTSAGASVSCASRVVAWGAGSWIVDTGMAGIESVACASAGGFSSCMAASGVGCWVADTVTAGIESVACASTGGFDCSASWLAKSAKCVSEPCTSAGASGSCASRVAAWGAGSWTVDTGTAGIESVACASTASFSSCMAASGVGCWVADTGSVALSVGGFAASPSRVAASSAGCLSMGMREPVCGSLGCFSFACGSQ